MSLDPITIAVITVVIIPVAAPFLMDTIACTGIAIMNKTKGKPTWVKGTRFYKVVWPSGHEELNVIITKVTFRTVTLAVKGGLVTIKKRAMFGMLFVVRWDSKV